MTTQYSLQQVATQAIYSVAAVSVASVAMGIVIAAMGPEVLKLPPEERKGTKRAIDDLRITFGSSIVNQAIENMGYDDILVLCKEIEKLYVKEMEEKYGSYAAATALKSAPPGDIKTANEIAIALARRGYGKFVEPRDVPAPAHVEQSAKREGLSKARQKAKPQKDTKTGIVYRSKAAAGMAVAAEYGLDSTETFIWYELIKKDPGRFVSATREQYEAYIQSLK